MKRENITFNTIILGIIVGFAPSIAWAQRTSDNLVTQSSDGFGNSSGNDRIGIYGTTEVRGFNPIDAGNARIAGLYLDQVEFIPQRLVEGSSIKVGITALGFAFPSPTGLVDWRLKSPGHENERSLEIEYGTYDSWGGNIEFKQNLIDNVLGISGGIGGRNMTKPEGGRQRFRNMGVNVTYTPNDDFRFTTLFGAFKNRGDEARPNIFPNSNAILPQIKRNEYMGQEWARKYTDGYLGGFLADYRMGDYLLRSGIFFQKRENHRIFSDSLFGVDSTGYVANRVIIADANSYDESVSGEIRLERNFESENLKQNISLSMRGRNRDRAFGGSQRIVLGPSSAIAIDARPKPNIVYQPKNLDEATQRTFGVSYLINWHQNLTANIGISKNIYRKEIDFADALLPIGLTEEDPILWNVAVSYAITPDLTIYGGAVRGQEEALVAPDFAANRAEAPPAVLTEQFDFGFRYKITRNISLITSYFSVKKPYFNVDTSLIYRQLGIIENKGVEFSLAGQLYPGLNIVSGAVILDPEISGEAVNLHIIGKRPVGQYHNHKILNLDWRLNNGRSPLSFDLAYEGFGSRVGNSSNTLRAPAHEAINLGFRYRFNLGENSALLRGQVQNLFDEYSWNVSTSGAWTYSNARTVQIGLTIDF